MHFFGRERQRGRTLPAPHQITPGEAQKSPPAARHRPRRLHPYLFDLPTPRAREDDGLSPVVVGSHRGHPVLLVHEERRPLDGDGPAQRLVKILPAEIVVDLQGLREGRRGEVSCGESQGQGGITLTSHPPGGWSRGGDDFPSPFGSETPRSGMWFGRRPGEAACSGHGVFCSTRFLL